MNHASQVTFVLSLAALCGFLATGLRAQPPAKFGLPLCDELPSATETLTKNITALERGISHWQRLRQGAPLTVTAPILQIGNSASPLSAPSWIQGELPARWRRCQDAGNRYRELIDIWIALRSDYEQHLSWYRGLQPRLQSLYVKSAHRLGTLAGKVWTAQDATQVTQLRIANRNLFGWALAIHGELGRAEATRRWNALLRAWRNSLRPDMVASNAVLRQIHHQTLTDLQRVRAYGLDTMPRASLAAENWRHGLALELRYIRVYVVGEWRAESSRLRNQLLGHWRWIGYLLLGLAIIVVNQLAVRLWLPALHRKATAKLIASRYRPDRNPTTLFFLSWFRRQSWTWPLLTHLLFLAGFYFIARESSFRSLWSFAAILMLIIGMRLVYGFLAHRLARWVGRESDWRITLSTALITGIATLFAIAWGSTVAILGNAYLLQPLTWGALLLAAGVLTFVLGLWRTTLVEALGDAQFPGTGVVRRALMKSVWPLVALPILVWLAVWRIWLILRRFALEIEQVQRLGDLLFLLRAGNEDEPQETDVPDDYRQRFLPGRNGPDPMRNEELLLQPEPYSSLIELCEEWKSQGYRPRTVALVGRPGCGASTLFAQAQRQWKSWQGVDVLHGGFQHRMQRPEGMTKQLCEWFGVEITEDPTTLRRQLDRIDTPRIVLLEDVHRLFLRRLGGFEAYNALTEIVAECAAPILWLLGHHRWSWNYIQRVRDELVFADLPLDLDGWTVEDIRTLIELRHEGSDTELVWEELSLVGGTPSQAEADAARDRYFRILWEQTNGNPQAALQRWIRSLRATRENRFDVRIPSQTTQLDLAGTDDDTRFVLAGLAIHEALHPSELQIVTGMQPGHIKGLIRNLQQHELVEDDGHRFRIAVYHQAAVEAHLLRRGYLYAP